MEHDFSLRDIVELAMRNEEKGYRFYSKLSALVKNQATRDVFHRLAQEEIEHQKAFEKLLSRELAKHGDVVFKEAEKKFLMAVITASVFPALGEGSEQEYDYVTPIWALSIGIQAEKDAILVYQEMYNKAKSQPVKDLFSRLIEEEKLHLVELRGQLEEFEHHR